MGESRAPFPLNPSDSSQPSRPTQRPLQPFGKDPVPLPYKSSRDRVIIFTPKKKKKFPRGPPGDSLSPYVGAWSKPYLQPPPRRGGRRRSSAVSSPRAPCSQPLPESVPTRIRTRCVLAGNSGFPRLHSGAHVIYSIST